MVHNLIYITSKWINFSSIIPASPLCSGQIVIWYWTWSSHREISWEAVSEKPPVNNFPLRLSTPLILRFRLTKMGVTVFVDSRVDAGTVVKILVSLLTYLSESDTRFEIAKLVPRLVFCLLFPVLLCLKLCGLLWKVGMHKVFAPQRCCIASVP